MRIEMNRKVDVVAYEVLATLAFPEDRTEVLSLLQMAEEFGSLTGEQVVDRKSGLLPGRPRVMGKRLLNMAADLDLLEQGNGGRYNLTEYGHETLENETVFVPEEASWTIWATKDALFPTTILHVERHREERPNRDRRGVQPLPPFVTSITNSNIDLIRPHHTGSSQVRVKEIKLKGRLSESKADLTLIIIADYGQETVARIRGKVGSGKGNQVDQRIQFEGPEHLSLFSLLMEQSEFGVDWAVNEGVLRAGFNELSLTELRNHLKTIHVEQPDLDNMGSFNSVELKSIPLIPRTGDDARKWAEWEFWTDFHGHPWPDQLNSNWAPLSERFDLLSHGVANVPSISNRIDQLRSIPGDELTVADLKQIRRCQAIIDLGGEPS